MSKDVKFSVLAKYFDWTSKTKSSVEKRKKFRKFLDTYCKKNDYFSSIRLILPSLDRERGNYGLKEAVLATCLSDALGISRDSEDAKKLLNWRKGGVQIAGYSAGNFSQVAVEVLQSRQSSVSGDITIGEVNELLDRLASAERKLKTDILSEMIRKTNWQEMKWIIKIILKDLKIGLSEKVIFREFHPDAEDVFNVTCDLRFICENLTDKNVRHKRQDIEVGKAVNAQLADRASDCEAAWKRLHGKEVVVECKFDGDRMQIHKNGSQVNYFSRRFIDHDEYTHGMDDIIIENVLVDKCILDGEMMVWDSSLKKFAKFGSNQETAKDAREGIDGDRQLCYVAFDVLYVEDTSVIHQTLKERHALLKKVVRPVKGRLEVVLPNGSSTDDANDQRDAGERRWSIIANNLEDVEGFFRETVKNRDEGIVLKDIGSKWEPGNRSSSKWLKVKPDYVNAGSDLDVLIIGGYYGSGRRGGEVGQFLVGLAERATPGTYPRRFVTFCRVGTGLSDEELDELVTKLKPYFIKYEYPKKLAPSFYKVTNHARERPDVWVESPEKSVIVSITSDIRTISSVAFAAPHSLRFPRIERVRYDKPWHECLDVQSFMDLVNSSNGTTQREGAEGLPANKKRARKGKTGGKKRLNLTVPSHFTQTDVSSVKGESQIFSNMVFHFVNLPSGHSLDSMHKLVVENGGTFSMNLNNTVTHCIGAESRGLKYEAAKRRGCDVIHYSWVLDCCSQKQLLPLRSTQYVFLSDSSRKKLQEEIDEFSDPYFWDLSVVELKQIFCNLNSSEVKTVEYYKKKYCPLEKWGRFHGCSIYFHLFANSHSVEWEWDVILKVAMRRMKVEVSLGGGKVSDNPSQATHVVIVSIPGHKLESETLFQSLPGDQKHIFRRTRLHVVGSQWLEDCLKEEKKLPEVAYSLKPTTLEEMSSEEEKYEYDKDHEKHPAASAHEEKPRKTVLENVTHIREPQRKRGRPVGTSTKKGKPAVSKPPRTKRARIGSRPAKLQQIASDDEISEQETDAPAKANPEPEIHDHLFQDVASDDKPSKLEPNTPEKSHFETENIELGSRLDLSETNENKEHKPEVNEIGNRCFDNPTIVTNSEPDKGTENPISGNLDTTFDPVQAMLFDMIPTLRRKPDATSTVSEEISLPSTQPQEGSSLEPSQVAPVQKKKVSFRELAKQLLKD
ncbi:DNA ligase 4 [Bienertia sinuspersici]